MQAFFREFSRHKRSLCHDMSLISSKYLCMAGTLRESGHAAIGAQENQLTRRRPKGDFALRRSRS